ncbi:MAG TPA: extracellular solute-binding protein [Caldilineaceae bacterium]|nr:extracellular solute-binding protein [Caldilineaceae bacterium]
MNLSRRTFLKWSSVTLTGAALAACAPQQPPAAPPAPEAPSSGAAASEGEAAPAQERIAMIYHTWTTGPENNGEQIGVAEFMKNNPDIDVELRQTPFADYWKALLTDAGIGQPPDAYLMNNFYWQQYINEGMGVDLLPSAALLDTPGTNTDEYIPSVLEAAKREGKLYGFPKAVNGSAFIINKTLFDEEGVPVPDPGMDWTYADFEAASEAMTNADIPRFGCSIDPGPAWTPTFLLTLGGRYLDPEEHRIAQGYLNSEENAFWVTWMKKLTDNGWMPAPGGLDAFGGGNGAMIGGNVAITHSDGMHQIAFARAEGSEYEWTGAKTPIPTAETELKTHLAIHGTMVPQGVKDVTKAVELAGYCAWGAATEMDGPTKMSPMTEYAEKQAFGDYAYFRPLYEQAIANYVEVHEGAVITHMDILVEEWGDMMERVLLEGMDPQQSLDTAAENYDKRVAEKEA